MIHDVYIQEYTKRKNNELNGALEKRFDDTEFVIESDKGFNSIYLEYIEGDYNSGVLSKPELTLNKAEYSVMLTYDNPKANDEENIDNYLKSELILDAGKNNE